jgi:hypothetical protein
LCSKETRNPALRGARNRYRTVPSTHAAHADFRVSARSPGTPMACALPFRPWSSPALRVFGLRTARDQSTDPSLVLSCPCTPPQWLAPKLVAPPGRLGRPCLQREAPRSTSQPFSMHGPRNPFFHPATAGRLEGFAVPSKSPALRVWLPSRRCKPHRPRKPLSAPHTPGLHPSELLLRPPGAPEVSLR